MILLAAELTGVAPCDFAVVGDARVDMLMARQAGALAVGVRESGKTAPGVADLADVVIDGVGSITLQA
jgi:phosphoglycolate phosphatase-like HAD superfamily hydrolase